MPDTILEEPDVPGIPVLYTPGLWKNVFHGPAREAFEATLPRFMLPKRWFGSKARAIRHVRLIETVPILPGAHLVILQVAYEEGEGETYALPVGFAVGSQAEALALERPAAIIGRLETGDETGLLYDAVWNPRFCVALLDAVTEGHTYAGESGELIASASRTLPRLLGGASEKLPPTVLGVEQSNTSVRYGDRLILKLYRRLVVGVNPDQEIGQFLTDKVPFAHTPPLAGVLEFRGRTPADAEPMTVGLLQGFVVNHGDAWRYTLDSLAAYFERAGGQAIGDEPVLPQAPLLALINSEIPSEAAVRIGPYLQSARLLGRRTAELHLALAADPSDPVFAPEPSTLEFQNGLHRSMCELTDGSLRLLRGRLDDLSDADRRAARQVLALEGQIKARFDALLAQPLHALRLRIHGDYHLGQVLYTGDDFFIIDFEGEPARPLNERRMKRSPLQDVAGMLRSFHYAAYAAYFDLVQGDEPPSGLEPWARYWHAWVSVAYLKTYLEVAGRAAFIPRSPEELKLLLDIYLVEKAVYELGYELNNRPTWARIPLQGLLQTVPLHQ